MSIVFKNAYDKENGRLQTKSMMFPAYCRADNSSPLSLYSFFYLSKKSISIFMFGSGLHFRIAESQDLSVSLSLYQNFFCCLLQYLLNICARALVNNKRNSSFSFFYLYHTLPSTDKGKRYSVILLNRRAQAGQNTQKRRTTNPHG